MEFLIIVFLLVLNGIFAMYEIALVSSSKARLETLVAKGNKSARGVLKQLEEPEKFLSTIQIGITLIGIGDTNCDPEELDYIIPGNDDAIRAVKLIVSKMADAVVEANQGAEEYVDEAEAQKVEETDEENA